MNNVDNQQKDFTPPCNTNLLNPKLLLLLMDIKKELMDIKKEISLFNSKFEKPNKFMLHIIFFGALAEILTFLAFFIG